MCIYYDIGLQVEYIIQNKLEKIRNNWLSMKVRITVGQLYISRSVMAGQTEPYVSIRSGRKRGKTRIGTSLQHYYNDTFELPIQNTTLNVKVKDSYMNTCFHGKCTGSVNTLLGQTEIDISHCFIAMDAVQGFYSLTYKGYPAGKVYLTIVPISK